jgi:hypothetical protein
MVSHLDDGNVAEPILIGIRDIVVELAYKISSDIIIEANIKSSTYASKTRPNHYELHLRMYLPYPNYMKLQAGVKTVYATDKYLSINGTPFRYHDPDSIPKVIQHLGLWVASNYKYHAWRVSLKDKK